MGRYLTGRRDQGKFRLLVFSRYVAKRRSASAGWTADGTRCAQFIYKDEFSKCSGRALSHRVPTDGSTRYPNFGYWEGANVGVLGCELQPTKNKCSEPWWEHCGPPAVTVVSSLSGSPRGSTDTGFSRFSRGFHDSNVDVPAATTASQGSTLMPSISPNNVTVTDEYFLVVKNVNNVLGLEGWERALQQLDLQLSTQLVTDVIKRQPNVSAALAFFQWAKEQDGYEHTPKTYKVILQKLMTRQDFKSRSIDTFQIIMKESLDRGWSPGVTVHTYLIDGLCKLGKVDEAIGHFDEMVAHGCAPNVVTYSSLIGGLVKLDRVEDALQLLDKMEEYHCHPNVVTFSVLIHGLVKNNRLDEACKIFDRMKMQGCVPNVITYSSLIDGAAKAGRFEAVSKFVDHMKKTRCVPSVFIYGTVINFFAKIGKLQRAWDLFMEMKEHGIEPNLYVYTPLLSSLGKAGKWDEAQGLLADMRSKGCEPDVVTYSAFVAGLVRVGLMDEGMRVLKQMEEEGCTPNVVIYTVLINGLLKAKQKRRAKDLYAQMVSKGCTPRHRIPERFFEEDVPGTTESLSTDDRLDVPRPCGQ